MRKQLLFLLITILSFNCYSQITFEKGYFINDSNERTECLIKNLDWRNTPNKFEYKFSEKDLIKEKTIEIIKEFGIYNFSKYIKTAVNIDRSSEIISELSEERNPVFKEEELFLLVLVEGKANLYEYVDGSLKRYFYKKGDSNIEQLVYKGYRTTNNKFGKNNRFRQQLWSDLECSNFKTNRIKRINYNKSDLTKLFVDYSECHNAKLKNFHPNKKKDFFNLNIRPRINNTSIKIQNPSGSRNTDFGNKIGIGFGLEAEFILPFNKNKWAFVIEPSYQEYIAEKTTNVTDVSGGKLVANVKYSSIEIPVSLRHYFFLNKNSKIFLNTSFIIDISSKSSLFEFNRIDGSVLKTIEILETGSNLSFGFGYKQNDRYSLEARYQFSREILGKDLGFTTDYSALSLIFGYTLF